MTSSEIKWFSRLSAPTSLSCCRVWLKTIEEFASLTHISTKCDELLYFFRWNLFTNVCRCALTLTDNISAVMYAIDCNRFVKIYCFCIFYIFLLRTNFGNQILIHLCNICLFRHWRNTNETRKESAPFI